MKLKSYRETLGISQTEAAKQLGISKDVYNSWEYEIRIPRLAMMRKITTWSGGEVMPNDFYNITERSKDE